jgi:hypothetical protein
LIKNRDFDVGKGVLPVGQFIENLVVYGWIDKFKHKKKDLLFE